MIEIDKKEYYSNCCDAPPLYELHDTGEYSIMMKDDKGLHYEEEFDAQPIGMCMKCREGAIFKIITENK